MNIYVSIHVCLYIYIHTNVFVFSLQTRGVLPYFANFRLISELSTPFVNQR